MTDTRTKEQIKADRNERARVRMIEHRKTDRYQEWLIESRGIRKIHKAKYRRSLGAIPRLEIKEKARQKALNEKQRKEIERIQKDAKKEECATWCEAHVIRYLRILKDRAKYAKRYASDPSKERERSRIAKAELRPAYIRQQLFSMGYEAHQITPEIIELKREQLSLRRLSREAEQAASEQLKEENETIAKHT